MIEQNTAPVTVTISFEEYEELQESRAWLNVLREHGVDNWEGYDDALDDYFGRQ